LWTPVATSLSPTSSENRQSWGPISATLQVPGFGSGVEPGLEPVTNIDYDNEKIAVDPPAEALNQPTPILSITSMNYPIGPDSSFSKFGGFCEGAKALTRGDTGFKIVKRPAVCPYPIIKDCVATNKYYQGHYSATVSARCISCSYEVGWNDVEKDRLLDSEHFFPRDARW
jgi:hypothetical protein